MKYTSAEYTAMLAPASTRGERRCVPLRNWQNDSLDINDITELLQEVGVQVIVLAGQRVEIH